MNEIEIVEAMIIRDPQPEDTLVVRMAAKTPDAELQEVAMELRRCLPCNVLVLRGDGIVIESIRDDR